jgi:peptide/nickel transport system permease protein
VTRSYVVRRLLQVGPTVFGILVLTFLMVHLTPGDPARDFAGDGADQHQIDAARSYLGLNRPLVQQFVTFAGRVLHGDLGVSYVQREKVTALIGSRLGPTLLLTGTALVISTVGGLLLGVLAAQHARGPVDAGISTVALIGYSLPAFWVAQLAVLGLALRLHLLPAVGIIDVGAHHTGMAAALDTGRHLILPALVLSVSEVALLMRVARSALVAESSKDYVRAARAKGLTEDEVMSHHALPNALLAVITVIASRIGYLVSGAVLVESVFAWPGLGQLLTTAALAGDQPVILGMVLLISSSVVFINLVTDLLYAQIDPRIGHR